MPALVQWLLGGAAWALTSGVGKFMASMGIAFIINEFVVDSWIDRIQAQWAGAPGFVLGILGWFGADKAVTIILSAYAIQWASGKIAGLARRSGAASGAAM